MGPAAGEVHVESLIQALEEVIRARGDLARRPAEERRSGVILDSEWEKLRAAERELAAKLDAYLEGRIREGIERALAQAGRPA